jgi:hypothetical protein
MFHVERLRVILLRPVMKITGRSIFNKPFELKSLFHVEQLS